MISLCRDRGYKKVCPFDRQKKPRQDYSDETRTAQHPPPPPSISISQEPQKLANFVLPADLRTFENSDFSFESNMSEFIPVPEVSCFNNVEHWVPLKLKQKKKNSGWSIYLTSLLS